MTTFLVIIHVFICLFLIVVILLQAGRGQGLSWGSFGGSPQSILGTKTTSFFTKLTSVCAVFFLVTCISLNIIETRKSKSLLNLSSKASQIDLDKIKQALEQVKKEQASTAAKTTQTDAAEKTENNVSPETASVTPNTEMKEPLPAEPSVVPQNNQNQVPAEKS